MKLYLIGLLLAHSLGDYYLQTPAIAHRKKTEPSALGLHCLLYSLGYLLLWFLQGFQPGFGLAAFIAVAFHALVDFLKFHLELRFIKEENHQRNSSFYLVDQAIHWLSLFVLAYLFGVAIQPLGLIGRVLSVFQISWQELLQWILALVLIGRPSNITFVKLFAAYRPEDPQDDEPGVKNRRAGATIGILEKMISLVCLANGELMALGLILTAKSIARYDRISKSPSFAEYYLIGTLSSLLMVLGIFGLVFKLLN